MPVTEAAPREALKVRTTLQPLPALLISHDCYIDKPARGQQRTAGGRPRIEELQFAPLFELASQDDHAQSLYLREEIDPAQAIFAGEVPGVGRAIASLGHIFTLPASIFDLRFQRFDDHPEADAEPVYTAARNLDNRIGRLEQTRLVLLRLKLIAFWTRTQGDPARLQ